MEAEYMKCNRTVIAYVPAVGILLLASYLAFGQVGAKQPSVSSIPYRWGNVRIVAGGFVDGILFHPTARDVAYLRTDMGGAYRWLPEKRAWKPITDGFS